MSVPIFQNRILSTNPMCRLCKKRNIRKFGYFEFLNNVRKIDKYFSQPELGRNIYFTTKKGGCHHPPHLILVY